MYFHPSFNCFSHFSYLIHSTLLALEEMVIYLCYFLLHLFLFWGGWDFVFLILYPQHTPRPGGCVFYLSYFLLHLFLFCEVVWISFFSFFTHSTLLACGRYFMLSTIPLHRILCCRRISSLLPCLLVCFRAKGCLMICFLFFRMSNFY